MLSSTKLKRINLPIKSFQKNGLNTQSPSSMNLKTGCFPVIPGAPKQAQHCTALLKLPKQMTWNLTHIYVSCLTGYLMPSQKVNIKSCCLIV